MLGGFSLDLAPPWVEVDNWMDVIANLWIGIVLVSVAVIPGWLTLRNHKSIQENHRDIKEETNVIRSQLVNGHKEPMRADLDRAIYAVEALTQEVRNIQAELTAEEGRRRSQINDMRDELHLRIDNIARNYPRTHDR